EDRFGLLVSGNRTAQPRHRTLRGLVDWSWDQLNLAQQVLLRRLAVFAGGWTQEAASQVCASDGLSAGEVATVLAELVDRSLVVLDDWRGSARHRLLDTIRAYAGERLRAAGEEASVRRRHQAWYLTLLESSDMPMMKDELGWLRELDAELENLRVAMDWCRAE